MKIIKTYNQNSAGISVRVKEETKLFAEGYKIESEEEIKDWHAGKACCLAIIFLPLILFGKTKMIKVVYIKND